MNEEMEFLLRQCNELITEMCPHCENEVELPYKLGYHECPECGVKIINCKRCVKMECNNCPIVGD